MSPSQAPDSADRVHLRQLLAWSVFAAVLVAGIVLWVRFSGRIVPMLDVLTDR